MKIMKIMKTRRTLAINLLVFVLGLFLILGNAGQAHAASLTTTEWETVADAIHAYVQDMCSSSATCEDDLLMTATTLAPRLGGSDGPSVGDDMANKPVLVDMLCELTTAIPGTSYRTVHAAYTTSCIAGNNSWHYVVYPTNATAIKNKVLAHEEAGFSTDIVVY